MKPDDETEFRPTTTSIHSDPVPLINAPRVVEALRDAGYLDTASAISELVDNALEADATRISIEISKTEGGLRIEVSDNGLGMASDEVRRALQYGGSSRFGSRKGVGRFGMGLPTSSFSQARRVEVESWQEKPQSHVMSSLDLQSIIEGEFGNIGLPYVFLPASELEPPYTKSGTIIRWIDCDRLDFKRVSTIESKLLQQLGRRFRKAIASGKEILINGVRTPVIDPLFLCEAALCSGAERYGNDLVYQVKPRVSVPGDPETGKVVVRFSELPVDKWRKLPAERKRQIGISSGAGVSILRAGREIDFGWYFLGSKRRENYDDWWRCEIDFEPLLDEEFGISHTKQGIRPTQYLRNILTPDVEKTARALTQRAREAHSKTCYDDEGRLDDLLRRKTRFLPPVKRRDSPLETDKTSLRKSPCDMMTILPCKLDHTDLYEMEPSGTSISVKINSEHPFYASVYEKAIEQQSKGSEDLKFAVDLIFASLARCEASASREDQAALERLKSNLSDVMATLLT